MNLLVLLYPLTFVVSLINPRWGFIGLITTMLVRPPDRIPSLIGFPGFELILMGIVLGMLLHSESLVKPSVKQDKLIAWIFALSIFGLMIQARGELIDETKDFVAAIVIYVFATRLIRNKSDFLTLVFWVSTVTVGLAAEAMHSFLTDPDSPFTDPFSDRMQGLGYYGNPNEFGKLMCTAIPFFGIFALTSKSFILRLVTAGGIALMITAIGLTQSRTCFVVLGIIVVVPFMISSNKGLIKRLVLFGLIGVGLIFVISQLPGPLQERMQSIVNFSSDESFQGRTRSWREGFQMVTWYPLYGVGKGQWSSYHGLAPHNSFVQIMAEMGIPGIIVFCMIVWRSWQQLVAYVRNPGQTKDRTLLAISKALGASYLGYLFYIFLGNQGYSPWTYFYFGLCAAFAHISGSAKEEVSEETRGPPLAEAKT
jgi:O-antigen ligase